MPAQRDDHIPPLATHALDAVAMRAAYLLRHWVEDEWIVGISSGA